MRHAIAIILAAVLATITAHADSTVVTGKVVVVKDGDTIAVLVDKQELTIRLAGIDAPEKKQPYGEKAKLRLSGLAFGKMAVVEITQKDKYGRSIGDIRVDGQWVNRQMVADGLAWHYTAFSKDVDLADAEVDAKKNARGLWADKEPVPPWEWRKQQKEKAKEE
jgi:endonuclease YncB( thermonuclease family)